MLNILASASRIDYRGEPAVQCFARDVTRRRVAERALRESEQLLRSVVSSVPIALIAVDSEGRFTLVEGRGTGAMNINADALLGRSVFDLFADRPELIQRVRRVLRGESVHTVVRFNERDVEIWYSPLEDGQGQVVGAIGVCADISERIDADRALRESERRWRSLVEQASDAILVARYDGPFVEVNSRACEMTGYTRDELLGMRFEEIDAFQSLLPRLQARDQTSRLAPLRFEMEFRRKDTSTFPVEVSVAVIEADLVLAIVRDITERRVHEQELICAKERAEEMSRLKTAFLANMSHEIRTPLTAIIGFADLLADEVSDEGREFARLIRKNGQRLLQTLASVLDLAGLESQTTRLQPEPIEIAGLLRDAIELFQPVAVDKGLELRLETCTVEPTYVFADRAALDRAFSNLISNALKFTHTGDVRVHLRPSGRTVRVQVEDTGVGIDSAFLPHIFDEFMQESSGLARNFEGSGLGLTVTKRLLDLMGGTISVESRKGRGTTFSVTLPRIHPNTDVAPSEVAQRIVVGPSE
jgi:PAS domain S-box-containing protein